MFSQKRNEAQRKISNSSNDSYSSRRSSTSSASSAYRRHSNSSSNSNYYVNKQPHDGLVKLLMIGDASVGKSSLVQRYVDDDFQLNWIPTIGIDVRLKSVPLHGKKFKVQVWDTAGQERYRCITENYFRGTDGFCLVFDLTDRSTFDKLQYWLNMGNRAVELNIPRIIVGNKCDLVEQRTVTLEEAEKFAQFHGYQYFETSAASGENVQNAFFDLVKAVVKNKKSFTTKSGTVSFGDKKKTRKKGRNCC